MEHKYPSLTPYHYVANNPLRYIDPDGKRIGNPNDPATTFIQYAMQLTPVGQAQWKAMAESPRPIYFDIDHETEIVDNKRAHGVTALESRGDGLSPTAYVTVLLANEGIGRYTGESFLGSLNIVGAHESVHAIFEDLRPGKNTKNAAETKEAEARGQWIELQEAEQQTSTRDTPVEYIITPIPPIETEQNDENGE